MRGCGEGPSEELQLAFAAEKRWLSNGGDSLQGPGGLEERLRALRVPGRGGLVVAGDRALADRTGCDTPLALDSPEGELGRLDHRGLDRVLRARGRANRGARALEGLSALIGR